MSFTEPPRLAQWVLEHCLPPGRDEALAGDLLEEFSAGRSAEWYWRQVLSAIVAGWMHVLGARGMLVLFAVLWSSLAPAWTVLLDRAVSRPNPAEEFWRMDAPFAGLSSFGVWLLLNVSFLWAGMLVYFVSHTRFSKSFSRKDVMRAFLVAAPVFPLAYFGTFVAMNLLFYPGPMIPRHTMSPFDELFDIRMGALALRVPYFVTMLCALWEAKLRFAFGVKEPIAAFDFDAAPIDTPAMFLNEPSERSPASFVRFLVIAGLINALILAVLLCRLPASDSPSLGGLFVRALLYVALGASAGTIGAWAYWRRAATSFGSHLPLPFGLFALTCAAGWVWVPAVVLLAEQDAPAAAALAAIGAALLAAGLRRAVPLLHSEPRTPDPQERELFAETLRTTPPEVHGYAIAICIYLAGFALNDRAHLAASGLLALSAFLFAWQLTLAPARPFRGRFGNSRAAKRLARIAIPAVLVTLWALLDGVAHRNLTGEANTASAHGNPAAGADATPKHAPYDKSAALDGYESIVLWPQPPKKEILAPVPPAAQPNDVRLAKPIVILFNGAYWYFQPPSDHPGPHAHVSHGSPLAVDIHSTTFIPLTMEAHQSLARPLRLSCCGAIEVEIGNRDNRPGALALAMILTDTATPGKPSLYLGQQPIVSSQPDRFRIKTTPDTETLRFAIPAHAPLKKFDEIMLVVRSDFLRIDMGARIAINQFELEPR
jgi:hypothetical protein